MLWRNNVPSICYEGMTNRDCRAAARTKTTGRSRTDSTSRIYTYLLSDFQHFKDLHSLDKQMHPTLTSEWQGARTRKARTGWTTTGRVRTPVKPFFYLVLRIESSGSLDELGVYAPEVAVHDYTHSMSQGRRSLRGTNKADRGLKFC